MQQISLNRPHGIFLAVDHQGEGVCRIPLGIPVVDQRVAHTGSNVHCQRSTGQGRTLFPTVRGQRLSNKPDPALEKVGRKRCQF